MLKSNKYIKLLSALIVILFIEIFIFSLPLLAEKAQSVSSPHNPDSNSAREVNKNQENNPVSNPLPRSADDTRITLDVKGMDVVDVLKILADKGELNLSINGNVRGRVTLFLKDVPIMEALDMVVVSANLALEKQGGIIYIMPARDYELKYGQHYEDKRETKTFDLKHTDVTRVKELVSQVVSKVGAVFVDGPSKTLVVMDTPKKVSQITEIVKQVDTPLISKVFELNYMPAEKVQVALEGALTPDIGMLSIDETSNKIFVSDYSEKIKEITRIIEAFDVKPLQVLIDAKIIELKPSDKFYSGVNWDYWIEKYFELKGAFTIPSPSATTEKVSLGTVGLSDSDISGRDDYRAIVEFLEIFGETRVLSTPRILALNNEESKILVGTRDAYITSSTSQVGESAVTSQEVNFVDVGVKLFVTPTINREGYITLRIRPEISSSVRTEITTEDKTTEIPIVTTSEAETTVILKDGVTVILGGLRKSTHTKETKGVPILRSIPGLGVFFRSEKDEWSKNELVILLTPHIVSGDQSIEAEIGNKMDGEIWEEEAIREAEKEFMKKREKTIDQLLDELEGLQEESPARPSVTSSTPTP